MKISEKAKTFWRNMVSRYGTRWGEERGAAPDKDWADLIDGMTDEHIRRAKDRIDADHKDWPPTFGQVKDIFRSLRQTSDQSKSIYSPLTKFVLVNYSLTDRQRFLPWKWIMAETTEMTQRGDPGMKVLGVDIPSDGESPGYRVMTEDMDGAATRVVGYDG